MNFEEQQKTRVETEMRKAVKKGFSFFGKLKGNIPFDYFRTYEVRAIDVPNPREPIELRFVPRYGVRTYYGAYEDYYEVYIKHIQKPEPAK